MKNNPWNIPREKKEDEVLLVVELPKIRIDVLSRGAEVGLGAHKGIIEKPWGRENRAKKVVEMKYEKVLGVSHPFFSFFFPIFLSFLLFFFSTFICFFLLREFVR